MPSPKTLIVPCLLCNKTTVTIVQLKILVIRLSRPPVSSTAFHVFWRERDPAADGLCGVGSESISPNSLNIYEHILPGTELK